MFLFKVAEFLLFQNALQIQTHCQKCTYCQKAQAHLSFEGQFSLLFVVYFQSQNRKFMPSLQDKRSKYVAGSYRSPLLLILFKRNQYKAVCNRSLVEENEVGSYPT
jgi:hypothetical protein